MPPQQRRLIAVLVLAALAPCVVLAFGKHPLDLDVYRHGGEAVVQGRPLYDVRLGRYGFTYPPFAALLFTWLGAVPLAVATVVGTCCSLAALALALRWTCGPLLRQPTRSVALLLIALVASAPVRETIWNGQVNLVLMALVLADVLGKTPGRGRGALVGVAAAVKLTPALFIVYLVVRGRRDDALRAVAAFLAATTSAAVLLPGDSARFWTHEAWAGGGIGDLSRVANQSLNGVVLRQS